MNQKLILFLRHLHRFGFINGLQVFIKNNVLKNSNTTLHIRKYTQPIYLRKNTSDIATFNQVILGLEYDYKLNSVPNFIIDCGANIGLSAVFFKSVFPLSTIVAIEPELSNFNQLVKNTCNYANVYCVHSGIWHKNAILQVVDERKFGHWGFECKEVLQENESTFKALCINDILTNYKQDSIDLLKIDIESAELELFSENYDNWLSKTKVIMIELHDTYRLGCSKSFFTAIVKYNFSVFSRGENIICIKN